MLADELELTRFRGHLMLWGSSLRKGVHDGEDQTTTPSELRADTVRLVRQSGKSIPQIARDLGVSDQPPIFSTISPP